MEHFEIKSITWPWHNNTLLTERLADFEILWASYAHRLKVKAAGTNRKEWTVSLIAIWCYSEIKGITLSILTNIEMQGWSGVGTRSHTFLQCITLKHGWDHTDVLATRRFALLVRSLQWNRKIQCGNTYRRMLTLSELFGAIFLFISCGVPTLPFITTPPAEA